MKREEGGLFHRKKRMLIYYITSNAFENDQQKTLVFLDRRKKFFFSRSTGSKVDASLYNGGSVLCTVKLLYYTKVCNIQGFKFKSCYI